MSKPLANGVRLEIAPGTGVAFDMDAFDDAVRSQGVQMVHYRGMRCPVGMIDQFDSRRPHDDHSGCSGGFLYRKAGIVTTLFTNSGSKYNQEDIGLLDGSSVNATTPRYYDDTNEPVEIVNYDRFYMLEEAITVPTWQLVEAHITGKDKLDFPAVKVSDIVDATGKVYTQTDFDVDSSGQIVWKPGSGPGFNVAEEKGVIYSIRYTYRPYYYVAQLPHQVRPVQVETLLERKVMLAPHEMRLQREYIARKEANDDQAPDPKSQRQVLSPRDGAFGPR